MLLFNVRVMRGEGGQAFRVVQAIPDARQPHLDIGSIGDQLNAQLERFLVSTHQATIRHLSALILRDFPLYYVKDYRQQPARDHRGRSLAQCCQDDDYLERKLNKFIQKEISVCVVRMQMQADRDMPYFMHRPRADKLLMDAFKRLLDHLDVQDQEKALKLMCFVDQVVKKIEDEQPSLLVFCNQDTFGVFFGRIAERYQRRIEIINSMIKIMPEDAAQDTPWSVLRERLEALLETMPSLAPIDFSEQLAFLRTLEEDDSASAILGLMEELQHEPDPVEQAVQDYLNDPYFQYIRVVGGRCLEIIQDVKANLSLAAGGRYQGKMHYVEGALIEVMQRHLDEAFDRMSCQEKAVWEGYLKARSQSRVLQFGQVRDYCLSELPQRVAVLAEGHIDLMMSDFENNLATYSEIVLPDEIRQLLDRLRPFLCGLHQVFYESMVMPESFFEEVAHIVFSFMMTKYAWFLHWSEEQFAAFGRAIAEGFAEPIVLEDAFLVEDRVYDMLFQQFAVFSEEVFREKVLALFDDYELRMLKAVQEETKDPSQPPLRQHETVGAFRARITQLLRRGDFVRVNQNVLTLDNKLRQLTNLRAVIRQESLDPRAVRHFSKNVQLAAPHMAEHRSEMLRGDAQDVRSVAGSYEAYAPAEPNTLGRLFRSGGSKLIEEIAALIDVYLSNVEQHVPGSAWSDTSSPLRYSVGSAGRPSYTGGAMEMRPMYSEGVANTPTNV